MCPRPRRGMLFLQGLLLILFAVSLNACGGYSTAEPDLSDTETATATTATGSEETVVEETQVEDVKIPEAQAIPNPLGFTPNGGAVQLPNILRYDESLVYWHLQQAEGIELSTLDVFRASIESEGGALIQYRVAGGQMHYAYRYYDDLVHLLIASPMSSGGQNQFMLEDSVEANYVYDKYSGEYRYDRYHFKTAFIMTDEQDRVTFYYRPEEQYAYVALLEYDDLGRVSATYTYRIFPRYAEEVFDSYLNGELFLFEYEASYTVENYFYGDDGSLVEVRTTKKLVNPEDFTDYDSELIRSERFSHDEYGFLTSVYVDKYEEYGAPTLGYQDFVERNPDYLLTAIEYRPHEGDEAKRITYTYDEDGTWWRHEE